MHDTNVSASTERLRDEPPSQARNAELPEVPVVTTGKKAKQGRWGTPVLWVLVVGLTLAVIAGVMVGLVVL